MTASRPPLALSLACAAAVATLAGLAAARAVNALSQPSQFPERLAALQMKTDTLRRALRPRLAAAPYPTDAVCLAAATEQQQLRDLLGREAGSAKMALAGLQVDPDVQTSLGETLFPLRLRFQAQGSYEGALALLQVLARQRPVIFADTVDLTSKTSSVTLTFSGRIFCSAGT